jgi:hypothetical protein
MDPPHGVQCIDDEQGIGRRAGVVQGLVDTHVLAELAQQAAQPRTVARHRLRIVEHDPQSIGAGRGQEHIQQRNAVRPVEGGADRCVEQQDFTPGAPEHFIHGRPVFADRVEPAVGGGGRGRGVGGVAHRTRM